MIYCVEDDADIREMMLYTLQMAGFKAQGFSSSELFWEAIQEKVPDLILLDIMLPGDDGLTILERLRRKHQTEMIPVIMTTAKGSEYDKVKGLDLGADDYLVKPFGMMEMISRIKAVLRRSRQVDSKAHIIIGNLEIDPTNYWVKRGTEKIHLTLKEFELLVLFFRNPNRVFTRQELLDKVWGEQFLGETRTVDVHIGTLRTKLGEDGYLIATVRGVGYRLEERHD
ncbi:TPA: response regulator transcription factor [Streptococcus agalactiae]|jgi:Response regulators consisting of a CheY-like receiver domain and a winged-helix DNA-binding domain|uniref:Phosphate regulon response regulator PhoB n=7 Tax=Bacilli TaxID=91061 RepID=Q8DX92_STRA5|nr:MULTISPECIES: response regulator transcription factor [Streptococcus]EAO63201.1 Response regulators consisting of a CheY-like receiver domain and a HTH DNA-binding domain [Streptococcus agalactiae 18RS21]EAO79130.1 phosphate regulon response regulator PhoB [Streptococcus agalactiae H36B]EPT68324.1 phosphate regulon response regulator PhoB [Streptococcus agalactiae CCUG 38383]EPX03461.1 phosphate regulon response regulator PhoB [Streptococcus agalactiae MRI Z1-049]MEE3705908.1 response regul